jgi:hypothetical protein
MEEANNTFIQFGCWNNLNTKIKDGKEKQLGCLNKVIDLLNGYLTTNKPKFLIISGDNYYPEKQKEDDVTKKIVIYPEKLIEGILKLKMDLPIYMMIGNHDLEKTPKEENPEQDECKILELEMANKPGNVEYNFFKYEMLKHGTMVLMIDTSIYEDGSEQYLLCYNKFFESSGLQFDTIDEIKRYQLEQIRDTLSGKTIKNIIIIGHAPILYLKFKKNKGVILRSDIRESFKPVLTDIYGMLGPDVNYSYLCSDLHLFQKGRVEIQIDAAKKMTIQQYIVGTGGTELDSALPADYAERVKTEDDITYTLEDEKAQCGFLECVVKEQGIEFTPIFVELKGGNKKTKNKRSKRSKRTKKRSKRNKQPK